MESKSKQTLQQALNKAFMNEDIKSCWAFCVEDHNIDKDGAVQRVMVECESQMGDPFFQIYFNVNAKPEAVLKVVKTAVGALIDSGLIEG